MNYEERLKSMGLKPFTKNEFLSHADLQNENRKNAIDKIDSYELISTHKVKDFLELRLYKGNKIIRPVNPVLILAKKDNMIYVFNGHYTYEYNMDKYDKYELGDSGNRKIFSDDGEMK